MKLLDKIALNRLLSIVTSFILGVLKIISPSKVEEIDKPDKPEKKKKRLLRRIIDDI
jgi:hypothetical protein